MDSGDHRGSVWSRAELIGLAARIAIRCLLLGALMAHARVVDGGKKIIPAIASLALTDADAVVISLRESPRMAVWPRDRRVSISDRVSAKNESKAGLAIICA